MRSPHRMASIASIGVLVEVAATGLAQRSATPNTQADVTARMVDGLHHLQDGLPTALTSECPSRTRWFRPAIA